MSKFPGFTSRCTNDFAWAAARPSAAVAINAANSRKFKASADKSPSVPPETYSMTKYSCPLWSMLPDGSTRSCSIANDPKSKTRTMLGCCKSAKILASLKNRCRSRNESRARTLIATSRCNLGSYARYTAPVPPCASNRSTIN